MPQIDQISNGESGSSARAKINNAEKHLPFTTASDPASNAAVSTAIIDANSGVVITLTGAGNNQVLQDPTDISVATSKKFLVINSDTSTDPININGTQLPVGKARQFSWDGSSWIPEDTFSAPSINTSGSGLRTGGLLTINADTTKFDLSAGKGVIVDNVTDVDNPTLKLVEWTTFSAQTVTNIATTFTTNIAIDTNGAIIQQNANFSNAQLRTLILIGRLSHINKTNVDDTVSLPRVGFDQTLMTADLALAIGTVNQEGNEFTPNIAGNLTIDKSSGKSFRMGVNYSNDKQTPNTSTDSAGSPITFLPAYRDGSGGSTLQTPTILINPDDYDDGSGTLASVPVNKYTNQRIFFFPGTMTVVVLYGQTLYNSLSEAKAALVSESFETPSELSGASFRAILSVKESTADLTNTTNAFFTQTGKFGDIAGGAGGGNTDLQGAYNNSSQPQITTDTGRGAVQVKRGSAADTDNIQEWLNGAGSVTTSVKGNGNLVLTNKLDAAQGSNIASATTTDIGAATGNYVNITGTTTITGLGTIVAGATRNINFNGILILTHNGTSLILPTGADITTAAGDTATFVSLGSGNWICINYQRKSGEALVGGAGGAKEIRMRIPDQITLDTVNHQGVFWRNTTGADITISNAKVGVSIAAAGGGAAMAVNFFSGAEATGIDASATTVFDSAIDLATARSDDSNTPDDPVIPAGDWLSMRAMNVGGATNFAVDLEAVIEYS